MVVGALDLAFTAAKLAPVWHAGLGDWSGIAGHFVDRRDDEVDATTILVESA
jgi:hypothetical protein